MLIRPNSALPPKRSTTGIVRGRSNAGYWVRARASVINANTPAMTRWRNLFGAGKMNYKAALAGTTPPPPGFSISALDAWTIFAETYFGILSAGPYYGGLQFPTSLTGCSTVEAFVVMVSTTLAQLNLPVPTAPNVAEEYLAFPASPYDGTLGNFAVDIEGASAPTPGVPGLILKATLTTTTQTTPPTALSGTAATCTVNVSALTTTQTPGPVFTSLPCSVNANGSHWNYDFGLGVNFGNLVGDLLTVTGFSHSAFNVTNAAIVANTLTTLSIANTSVPATLDIDGSGSVSDTDTYQYTATITVLPSPSTAAGSITLSFQFTDNAGTHSTDLTLSATAGSILPAIPSPFFQTPSYLSAHAIYDDALNIAGIYLTYSVTDTGAGVMQRGGAPLPNQWIVTASAAYTNSYAAPDPSTWKPLTYNGQVSTNSAAYGGPPPSTPDQILDAWEAVYGPIPDSGKIKFQVKPVDPTSGCPGPALSCTLEWQNGTLLGAIIGAEGFETPQGGPAWWGAAFFMASVGSPYTVTPGTPLTFTAGISGDRGYNGTVTFTAKSKSPVPNGNNSKTHALPPGVTVTFTPPTIDIVADLPTGYSTTVEIDADPATAALWSGNIDIEASDGVQTATARTTINVAGSVILPPSNFLTISPANSTMSAAAGTATTALLTLENTGPDDINLDMLSGSTNPNLSAEFGTGATASATATSTTITFALATGAADNSLIGQTLSSAGYSPDGYNVTDATIVANDASTITVASANAPGTMTTAGVAAIINNALTVPAGTVMSPGTVETYIFVTPLPGNEIDLAFIQIEASAGVNIAYAAISVTTQASGPVQMTPFTAPPITTRLTPWVIDFTVTNTDPGDVTLAISTLNPSPIFALTFSETTVYLPGGSIASPGSASFSVTATIELGPGTFNSAILIAASTPSINLLGTIPVNVT